MTDSENTLLATRAGIYRERPASGRLARYFHCYWAHGLPDNFSGRVAIVPDGFSDLIWTGERLIVIDPDRSSAFPELNPGSHIRGLRFRPGAALTWLDAPLCELVGRATPRSQSGGARRCPSKPDCRRLRHAIVLRCF